MALLNSRSARGKCPVCGAANCQCNILAEGGTGVQVRKLPSDGPMVHIPMGRPGVTMQMPLARAEALGLWPLESEAASPKQMASNKRVTGARNKKREPEANK